MSDVGILAGFLASCAVVASESGRPRSPSARRYRLSLPFRPSGDHSGLWALKPPTTITCAPACAWAAAKASASVFVPAPPGVW